MISDYGKILTGLIDNISGFRNLRPSASRNAHLMGLIAETVEVIHLLRTDVLEYVKNHIVLETGWHIDYVQKSDEILQLELPTEDEKQQNAVIFEAELMRIEHLDKSETGNLAEMAKIIAGSVSLPYLQLCKIFNDTLGVLSALLLEIADEQSRHRKEEEYVNLYEEEKKRYYYSNSGRKARKSYDEWREKECYGSPDIEELRDYILLKLLSMFDKGVFASKAARRQRVTKYPGEIDFESIEDPEKRKKAYKNYDVFRKIVDYRDGFLIVDAYHAGHHFYTSKDEPNAKTLRNYFLKYIIKIELAQEEIRRLQAEQAEAAKRLAAGEKELNYFAPTKNLKMLFREEWFGMLTTDEGKYSSKWTDPFVDALMSSEWRELIAQEWDSKERRLMLKCMVIGVLKDAGVLRGSYNSIARLLDMDDENPATLAKYMGLGKKQPFAEWITQYVNS